MNKVYNFAMGFTGCVLLAVLILMCGGFNAMQISAPAVFATLGAIGFVALAWLGFVIFRDRVFKDSENRSIKAVIATILSLLIIFWMMWMEQMAVDVILLR